MRVASMDLGWVVIRTWPDGRKPSCLTRVVSLPAAKGRFTSLSRTPWLKGNLLIRRVVADA